jgi:hypothetical protein
MSNPNDTTILILSSKQAEAVSVALFDGLRGALPKEYEPHIMRVLMDLLDLGKLTRPPYKGPKYCLKCRKWEDQQ